MRHFWIVPVFAILSSPAPVVSQARQLDADLSLASAYEWRGLKLDPGANLQYSVLGSLAWADMTVTAGAWSLTDLSCDPSEGLPLRWAPETNPWVEAAVGGVRRQAFLGAVGYLHRRMDSDLQLRKGDTWEVYTGVRGALDGLPLMGEAVLFWDMDRVGGGYGELAGALQIPVWTGIVAPIGSLFLEGRAGFSLGQEQDNPLADPGSYHFRESGPTHVDLSLRTTLLPLPLGPAEASLTMETHWTRSLDPETRRIGFTTEGPIDSARWHWVLGIRLDMPRCDPQKELCRDL